MSASDPGGEREEDGQAPRASAFERALRKATASTGSHGLGPGTAAIPELRRALGSRFGRDEFDRGLRRLERDGAVELKPHGHPECLSASEVREALQDGGSILYLLRW